MEATRVSAAVDPAVALRLRRNAANTRAYIYRKYGHVCKERRYPDPIPMADGSFGIPLSSRKYPGLVTLSDAQDLQLFESRTLSPKVYPHTTYAETWYEGKVRRVHQILFGVLADGFSIDHINGDGLDNRRKNLRIATAIQQSRNRAANRTAASKFVGVSRKRHYWKACIDGRDLGAYDTEEAAALARDFYARIEFGEFARLNFPNVVLSEPPERRVFVLGKRVGDAWKLGGW